jgi:diguanylate cyclase (GGDEF)-like protein/PAS domain S-box-containing protein
MPGMLTYWDVNQRCRFANAAYKEWFGVGPAALIGRTLEELLGSSYSLNLPYIEAALRGETQMFEREIPDPTGGPSRYSLAHYVPDVVNGVVQGFVVIVSDITMRRDLERELRRPRERAQMMATRDHLTGLPNRILFQDRVSCAIENAKRNSVECSVLFLELHDFKQVSDTFGLEAGDAVLGEVGRRLSESLRASDTVSRVGDSDFIVLLPEIDTEQAAKVAGKLLRAVAREPFDVCDRTLTFSSSVGIAMYPGDGADPSELIARADSALYDAKRAGKDQIAYFASGKSTPPS